MSDPFIGEIRLAGFASAPRGWANCDGQAMVLSQNQALFSLLGVSFGGNGTTTFNLPDMRQRVPVHRSASLPVGAMGGEAAVTLQESQMPAHLHLATAGSGPADTSNPAGAYWADAGQTAFGSGPGAPLQAGAIAKSGGGQPHNNLPPQLVVNFIIALSGIYPNRN